jgi:hypothetical protein
MKNTLKEKVLQFVEQRGSVRFTDIQRFIVDMKYGQGTYDKRVPKRVWDGNKFVIKGTENPYRGYHSTSLTSGGRWTKTGYFLTGPDFLVKGSDGRYTVVRTTKPKVQPVVTRIAPEANELRVEVVNRYLVDQNSGKVVVLELPKFDRSWMTNPYIFEAYAEALEFSETLKEQYAAKLITEDEMDIIQEELEEQLAEEMIQEFEECSTEPSEDINLHDLIKNLLPVKAGQEIFVLDQEDGYIARMYKTTVTEVIIYTSENETTWEIMTSEDDSFADNDLNVKFFTDKQKCLAALNELF